MHSESPPDEAPRAALTIRQRATAAIGAVRPSRIAWRGATLSVVAVSLLVWGSSVYSLVSPVRVAGPAALAGAGVAVAGVGAAVVLLLLALFARIPWHFRWAALGGCVLVGLSTLESAQFGVLRSLAATAVLLATAALLGGSGAVVLTGRWREASRFGRRKTATCGLIALAVIAVGAYWLIRPGPPRPELQRIEPARRFDAELPALPDPAEPGAYPVAELTYGTGMDRHRAEFAGEATLRTEPVDGSDVLKGWDGFTGWARSAFFGFDVERLPLNGRVWYPQADGAFPLVLIVHGNHTASDFSDPGYQYLGEHLASRGFICVSVDENFLNSMESDLWWGLDAENNARGWLLLEHLRVWHAWNRDPASPFFEKVDTERIALVGHSRGGEAVAHAAAFNRLPCNPDNALAKFDYGYNIRSVVAIAPADGQYQPAGMCTRLDDINYFTIHGSHDGDVWSFVGLYQYDRVNFSGDGRWFKSAVYVYGANHGQFNTRWGTYDMGAGLTERVLNTRALLPADQQRRIAVAYITAFLECTLRGRVEYRRLFENARQGSRWLPDTVYLTQYADSSMRDICNFDEDINLESTTVEGGTIAARNLTLWHESRDDLRAGTGDDRAAWLGWDVNEQPGETDYTITWPAGSLPANGDSVLTFTLADGAEDPTPHGEKASDDEPPSQPDGPREPIDVTIEVVDAEGHPARLPLSHDAPLRPQIETQYLKSRWLHAEALSEPIPQTFRFPLADFRAANPELDPATVSTLRLKFDRTESGVVILDNVAIGASLSPADTPAAE